MITLWRRQGALCDAYRRAPTEEGRPCAPFQGIASQLGGAGQALARPGGQARWGWVRLDLAERETAFPHLTVLPA
jgi:hypothetical protein